MKGIKIPGQREKVPYKLFADDTLVYLCEDDRIRELDWLVNKCCEASTARFSKTRRK